MEAGVEAVEGFEVMESQDGSAQQGQDLASAGFLARSRGVFLPEAGVALPVVLVFHRPVTAHGLCEAGGASLVSLEAGDEVAGLAFECVAFSLKPFAGAADELPRSGKRADVLIQIDPGEVAALDPTMTFFPVAHPFVEDCGRELVLRELVEGGLVVLEA